MAIRPTTQQDDSDAAHGGAPAPARDFLALGVVIVSVAMFVAAGSGVLTGVVRKYLFDEANGDAVLANALILNIALLILSWRRHAALNREIAERRKAEQAAHVLAHTDALTGCLNRRSIDGLMRGLVERAERHGGEVVALMIDLDKFKRSNDFHGHQVGDAVLIEIARRLRAAMPAEALIARLGGDEFICAAIFAQHRAGMVEALCTRLNEALAEPIEHNGTRVTVTASIGIADEPPVHDMQPAQLAADLLHRADLAMYRAKKAGGNRFCRYEEAMAKELRFRRELENDLREGLDRGEFVPYYEKQMDLETGVLTGFEMLARWHSPRFGLISPEHFIPVAEEVGLIAPLSEALIAQALIDARDWDPRLTLSVNISPVQLRDPQFAQKILKLLVAANFPPSRLDIEITEVCLHENIEVVRSLITSLQNQGIRISLDDFGTGYASIAQLRALPFDRIKIDRSFISTLASSTDNTAIVEAITSLGRGMAMPITAEGIESSEVLESLRKLGKFKGQGYLYGQPASASETRRLLREQQLLAVNAPPANAPAPIAAARA
ncbi:EAL domain-containing protein [Novosphingobium sp. Chol11]|uniref:putative bifunctional diguanylate cyclase/phosphodiesterase n=1 Tax=Novosphingobium sp. Chol11 TaxID=1385763 RepID=UPI0025CF2EF7|nr:EAL domain-containing protein [Novosphingobium sp. Chol11]